MKASRIQNYIHSVIYNFFKLEWVWNPKCVCVLFTIVPAFLKSKTYKVYCIPYKIISFYKQTIFVTSSRAILFTHNGHKIFVQLEYNIKESYVCFLLKIL